MLISIRKKVATFLLLCLFIPLAIPAQVHADSTVYITRTGSKYHTATCGALYRSKIPISLSSAIAQGYEPCKRCHPPTSSSSGRGSSSAGSSNSPSNSSSNSTSSVSSSSITAQAVLISKWDRTDRLRGENA